MDALADDLDNLASLADPARRAVYWFVVDHAMIKLPGDEFIAIELVHNADGPTAGGDRLSHLVIQVESMDVTLTELAAAASTPRPPPRPTGRRTSGRPDGRS